MRNAALLGSALTFAIQASVACATDGMQWPAWRGPTHQGVSQEGTPPTKWSETRNVKWKTALPGEGQSTPVIWGDHLFLQNAIPVGEEDQKSLPDFGMRGPTSKKVTVPYRFVVLCLSRRTGSILWETTVCETIPHEGYHPTGSLAPHSPVTDGARIWCSFGSRGLYCLDFGGDIVWRREGVELKMAGPFGEGSSPLLVDDLIIVLADHEGPSAITAYSKLTGETVWQTPREEISSWSTPVSTVVNGRTEVIVSATNAVRSYDAKTGALIWTCSGLTHCAAASPVVHEGMVYCSTGFRGISTMAIALGHEGDLTGTDAVRWTSDKVGTNVPSPLVYDGRLYILRGYAPQVSCFDAESGELLFHRKRMEGMKNIYASPLAAGGNVYFCSRNGTTTILRASDKYHVIATSRLGATLDGTPVALGNELFLRGRTAIYCIAEDL